VNSRHHYLLILLATKGNRLKPSQKQTTTRKLDVECFAEPQSGAYRAGSTRAAFVLDAHLTGCTAFVLAGHVLARVETTGARWSGINLVTRHNTTGECSDSHKCHSASTYLLFFRNLAALTLHACLTRVAALIATWPELAQASVARTCGRTHLSPTHDETGFFEDFCIDHGQAECSPQSHRTCTRDSTAKDNKGRQFVYRHGDKAENVYLL